TSGNGAGHDDRLILRKNESVLKGKSGDHAQIFLLCIRIEYSLDITRVYVPHRDPALFIRARKQFPIWAERGTQEECRALCDVCLERANQITINRPPQPNYRRKTICCER